MANRNPQPKPESQERDPKISLWQNIADVTLAVLLQQFEDKLFERALWYHSLLPQHFPPLDHYQTVWSAIISLRERGDVVTPQTVYSMCEGKVKLEWIMLKYSLYDDLQAEAFDSNVRRLIDFGVRYIDLVNVREFERRIVGAPDRRELASWLITKLSENGYAEPGDPTFSGLLKIVEDDMELEPPKIVSTGIGWLDRAIGGFVPGALYVVAGRFKDRKTTLSRNMTLGAARSGGSVTFASYEVSQKNMLYDHLAMLAVEHLWREGQYSDVEFLPGGGSRLLADTFNGKTLQLTRNKYREWDKRKRNAWEYAKEEARAIGNAVRVYDRSQNGGQIYDPPSLKIKVKADRDTYGAGIGQVLLVDHIQIVGDTAIDLTPRTERYMNELQELAASEDITVVVLSQLNEQTVKGQGKRGEKSNRTPGGKGSGALHSACDVFLVTRYGLKDGEIVRPDWLDVNVALSRFTEAHSEYTERLQMHPASGMILGVVDDD